MGYKVHSINGQMGEVELPTGGSASWDDVTGKPATFPPATHTHTAAQVSDATTVGRSVLTATDAAAARTAIGAGTSSLAIGTTASTAAAGTHTHTAAQVGAASATHTHAAADVVSGVLALARIPTGVTASTVSLGNHTHTGLLSGSAAAVADATDEASAITQLNALLAVLRSRGILSGGG